MVVNMYKHMGKVVIKILQGSAVTQTVLGGLTILSSGCNFPIVYMCQKLWKLAGSRQSYCKNYLAYFFLAHPVFRIFFYFKNWWNGTILELIYGMTLVNLHFTYLLTYITAGLPRPLFPLPRFNHGTPFVPMQMQHTIIIYMNSNSFCTATIRSHMWI